jgi:hypothetical protein
VEAEGDARLRGGRLRGRAERIEDKASVGLIRWHRWAAALETSWRVVAALTVKGRVALRRAMERRLSCASGCSHPRQLSRQWTTGLCAAQSTGPVWRW